MFVNVLEVEESCHCHRLSGADYKSMIVSTFGEFFGKSRRFTAF